jgi:hypothetical protein
MGASAVNRRDCARRPILATFIAALSVRHHVSRVTIAAVIERAAAAEPCR